MSFRPAHEILSARIERVKIGWQNREKLEKLHTVYLTIQVMVGAYLIIAMISIQFRLQKERS